MYLTNRETALVSDIFAVLADALPEDLMRREIGVRMLDLLRADYLGSYVWDATKKAFVNRVALNMSDDNLSEYEQYYQYHDTVTPLLQNCRQAVRVTDVLPQAELVRTELFNDFLRRDGLHWGMDVFAWSGETNIGDLRIWRGKQRDNFSDHDLALAELIRPAFTSGLARARRTAGMTEAGTPHTRLISERVLKSLTAREREVVSLIMEGLLDKQIAERLGISYTTVRTHVDRSFQKLGVGNRSALIRMAQQDAR
ncbi:DNA-binding CsgD family transcriptional regulator [Paraburkholderia sp. GAS38]|jgi:DNA-binding CsgD family transcriptional regulator|uniref:helix-turn-helix transcriptional regulator n=1 Tax=Paraburkholderia sp. GAS38 TaxID=3035133 RepID=UPI003D1E69D0